jgi:hypothetical protein
VIARILSLNGRTVQTISGKGRGRCRFPRRFEVVNEYKIQGAFAAHLYRPVIETYAAGAQFGAFGQLGDQTEPSLAALCREYLDG